ncbi:MAG: C40 family peptidase [Chitinophagales bacterium]|nr:C40 family peptidase [Chitinophagales bacterium]
MEHGITSLSLIPVRSKPGHEFEQVTQLLFGEIYSLVEKQARWVRIIQELDGYSGWIHENQHHRIQDQQFKYYQKAEQAIVAEIVQTVTTNHKSFPVLFGSTLFDFDGMNFKMGKENYVYAGKAILKNVESKNSELLKKLALKFLHAPYVWGGRNPFGIDCSGFTQIIYKALGIYLPRDAYQQAEIGKTVNFIYEAKEADLAFFDNPDGHITHVGIIIGENEIIHASGNVRVDTIDHYGIFNKELKKYSHKLRIIKRIV